VTVVKVLLVCGLISCQPDRHAAWDSRPRVSLELGRRVTGSLARNPCPFASER
jgi:hypothetical protein